MKNVIKVFLSLLIVGQVYANQGTVKIIAPNQVKKGEEITVTIKVFHRGNSKNHYIKTVYVMVNDKKQKQWSFSPEKLPESENFERKFKVKIENETKITAEAICDPHGSGNRPEQLIKIQ